MRYISPFHQKRKKKKKNPFDFSDLCTNIYIYIYIYMISITLNNVTLFNNLLLNLYFKNFIVGLHVLYILNP